jgi:hypothetical protein
MECPYCNEKLIYRVYCGKLKRSEHYWIYPSSWIERERFFDVKMNIVICMENGFILISLVI